jgi:hypothetical protein
MAPINLHDVPHDVCHANSSMFSLLRNLIPNGLEKFLPRLWDVPNCNDFPSGIIPSRVVVDSAPTNFSLSLLYPVIVGIDKIFSIKFL